MTTDFAMQNVLKQIGLNILGTDGMVIPPISTSSGLVGDHELLSGDQGDEDLDLEVLRLLPHHSPHGQEVLPEVRQQDAEESLRHRGQRGQAAGWIRVNKLKLSHIVLAADSHQHKATTDLEGEAIFPACTQGTGIFHNHYSANGSQPKFSA